MMLPTDACPDLELLFAGVAEGDEALLAHARECPACSLILEDHRQLEKDLFRIQDPLPPPDFTLKVMARVSAAPAPVAAELRTGIAVLAVAVGLFVTTLFAGGRSAADAGATLARGLIDLRLALVAGVNGLEALWATAAAPLLIVSFLLLASSLFGLRRLTSAPQSA